MTFETYFLSFFFSMRICFITFLLHILISYRSSTLVFHLNHRAAGTAWFLFLSFSLFLWILNFIFFGLFFFFQDDMILKDKCPAQSSQSLHCRRLFHHIRALGLASLWLIEVFSSPGNSSVTLVVMLNGRQPCLLEF